MALSGKKRLLEADDLWEYALRCLDRKPYSAAELKLKLKHKAASPDALRQVTEKLHEYGLLNDQKFAESFATARLESRGYGASRVMRDLQAHRIAASTAAKVVQQVYDQVDERTLVRQFLERKFRSKDLPAFLGEPKNLASAYRRLRTAGFSANASIGVLREYSQRADEIEEAPEVEEDSEEA